MSGNAKLTMGGGIYIIEGGGFSVSGNSSVTGSGVMIFNAGSKYPSTGGTYGSITLSGTGTFNLSPATSGLYAGIVFFQPRGQYAGPYRDRQCFGNHRHDLRAGGHLSESGNAALDASLIVDTLTISGNGTINGPSSAGPAVAGVGLDTTVDGITVLSPDNLLAFDATTGTVPV